VNIQLLSGLLYNKQEEYKFDDDDDDDSDDDNVEFQENQQSSIECEASTHPAEELGLLVWSSDSAKSYSYCLTLTCFAYNLEQHEKERKERMFLFQLPKTLPLPRRPSIVEAKGKATNRQLKEGSNLQQLPQGYLGKILVYKSGKIKMKIGDVMFDVSAQLSYFSLSDSNI
jgi:DNA-directed RNA polymerase III subunit RPC4